MHEMGRNLMRILSNIKLVSSENLVMIEANLVELLFGKTRITTIFFNFESL